MAILRRPVPRFFVWAAFLIAVATGAAAGGFVWWLIAVLVAVAWAIVSLAERTFWQLSVKPKKPERRERVAEPVETVTDPVREPEPTVVRVREKKPEPPPVAVPDAEPVRRRMMRPATKPVPVALTQWNIWTLEKLARDRPNAEELEFLVQSLRDFADADGGLPPEFDSLVRESFGSLLPG